jgi:hypothetical protein
MNLSYGKQKAHYDYVRSEKLFKDINNAIRSAFIYPLRTYDIVNIEQIKATFNRHIELQEELEEQLLMVELDREVHDMSKRAGKSWDTKIESLKVKIKFHQSQCRMLDDMRNSRYVIANYHLNIPKQTTPYDN